jgi:hypothetical protein
MKRSRLSRDILIILILTVITIFLWIGLEVVHILQNKDVPKVLQEQLEPLDPKIDTEVLNNLSAKNNYTKEDLPVNQKEILTPTPSPSI